MCMLEISIENDGQCKLTVMTQAPGKNGKKNSEKQRQTCDVASHGYKGTEFLNFDVRSIISLSTCAVIGQFSGPYPPVRPAKI